MPNISQREWDKAQRIADRKLSKQLQTDPNFTGLIKIRKKNYLGLYHTFIADVKAGKLQELYGMSRKQCIEVGEGIIGEGSFSTVAIATLRNGTPIAVKYQGQEGKAALNKQIIDEEMTLLEAARELRTQGYLINKKNITKHYTFMKFKPGKELFEHLFVPVTQESAEQEAKRGGLAIPLEKNNERKIYIRGEKINRKEQLLLAIKCLQAIEYLHSQNIVHRDIKSQNIMACFGNDNIIIVSLIDMGLAHQLKDGQKETKKRSPTTPFYAAPEVTQGIICKANDIYSTGVMFIADFGMTDSFIINNMLTEDRHQRLTATQCREFFEKELRKVIEKEVENKKRKAPFKIKLKKESAKKSKEQEIDLKMKALLATEEELLKKIAPIASPQENRQINGILQEIRAIRLLEDAKKILHWGYKLMVRIVARVPSSKKLDTIRNELENFGNRIRSLFSKKENPFAKKFR